MQRVDSSSSHGSGADDERNAAGGLQEGAKPRLSKETTVPGGMLVTLPELQQSPDSNQPTAVLGHHGGYLSSLEPPPRRAGSPFIGMRSKPLPALDHTCKNRQDQSEDATVGYARRWSDELHIDRHESFSNTVTLAGQRHEVQKRGLNTVPPLLLSSLEPGTTLDLSQATWAEASRNASKFHGSGSRAFGSDNSWTSPRSTGAKWSHASTRSMSSRTSRSTCGVALRVDLLSKQDTIPDRNSGKRVRGVMDTQIRLFIRLPGKGRLAVWVPPDLPLGPPRESEGTCVFTKFWGADAELRGPFAGKVKKEDGGRVSPLRGLMAQTMLGGEHMDSTAFLGSLPSEISKMAPSTTMSPEAIQCLGSLKGLLAAATGVEPEKQKLTFRGVGALEDDSKPLFAFGVGHGALLLLSVRPGKFKRQEVKLLATKGLADSLEANKIAGNVEAFLETEVSGVLGKDLVEHLPSWVRPKPKELHEIVEWPHENLYHDFTALPDNNIFDLTGRVRKKFNRLPRLAKASAASRKMEAGLPFAEAPNTVR